MNIISLKFLAKRIALVLVVFSLCRLLFLIFNWKNFADAEISSLLFAFILGVRFDVAVLFTMNSLFLLMSILPVNQFNGTYQKILKILFYLVNVPLTFINLIDVGYFKYRYKRTTAEVFGIWKDVQEQSMQILVSYWHLVLIALLLVIFFYRLYPTLPSETREKRFSKRRSSLVFITLVALIFFGIRGGLQLKPLRPNHAFILSPNILGNVVLNTPFSIVATVEAKGVDDVKYFNTNKEVVDIIYKQDTIKKASKDNVVIIIVESLSKEYISTGNNQKGYTPFFDSLAKEGLFFNHHFANGTTSIEAVPAIVASIPSLMEESYITSIYQTNQIHGLAEELNKHGYHSSFFHGGKNGTMGFDVFAKNAGFQHYYGMNEYPHSADDFDGNWGIFDEPYLQYFCQKLSSFPQPFLGTVFTLSSHHPYTIPEKLRGKFPKGKIPILESIGYADYSLQKFFECASKKSWYKNTYFVITADHTQEKISKFDIEGEFRVPLLIYHPGKRFKGFIDNKVTQHVDIMPTLLSELGIRPEKRILFGQSVLSEGAGEAITQSYGSINYNLIGIDYYYQINSGKGILTLMPDRRPKGKSFEDSLSLNMSLKLKAYIQYYLNGLNHNNWYSFEQKK